MNNICHLYEKNITLEQALSGGNFKIQIEQGKTIKVRLKPGSFNGQVIRLKNTENSPDCAKKDTFIKLHVLDHPLYNIDGINLRSSMIVSPAESEMGCEKKMIGPSGKQLSVNVKAKSKDGDEIIVEGAGLSDGNDTGNIVYKIKIDFLDEFDEAAFLNNFAEQEFILN
jgi:molecular chaperone DnaJ